MNRLRTPSLRLVLLIVTGLMPAFGHASGLGAQETGASEPIVVLNEDGVEVSVIGSATVQVDSDGDAYLTLERIFITEGAAFGPWTPASPELMVMEDGELLEQDERGFWSRMEAPYQMVLEPGTPVNWSAAEATSLLRLRLTDTAPDDAAFDGVEVERVAQFRLDAVLAEPVLVFVAEASLSGRGGGARLEHDSSVGIVVESGAIDVLSPSGLEGRLGEGQSALYSNGASIEFLGTSDGEPASALLAGVSTTDRMLEESSAAASVATVAVSAQESTGSEPTSDELAAMLPAAGTLPIAGLDAVTDSALTEPEVVAVLGGNREAETNLATWGWSGNATRSYAAADPAALSADATTNITVSLHGFASDAAAAEALTFYSDVLINLGYQEVEVGDIGALNRMMVQPQEDGGTTVALYVQQGPVLYRIGGYSPGGDPTRDVIRVAEVVLGR